MESVTVRFQKDILKKIDKNISEHDFNSRTEFIREAVRDKISVLSRDDLAKEFMKFRGKAKKKVSDKDLRKAREQALKELVAERGWD